MLTPNEIYNKQAEIVFQDLKSFEKQTNAIQAEYGKWMINTLYLLNAGAIVGLLSKVSTASAPSYLGSLWWFVAGILLAMLAALSTWWNFTFTANIYSSMADYRMLHDPKYWPTLGPTKRVTISMWLALSLGVASMCCLPAGAYSVWYAWR